MKKTYIKPEISVFEINFTKQILAGSVIGASVYSDEEAEEEYGY